MKDFYTAFYTATEHSQAHHAFCERVFGMDLCQHGFADVAQLELLLQVTQLGPAHRVLDLGCGNGMIAEYLSDRSGALFIYENRLGDAGGIRQAIEDGLHARYLYHVDTQWSTPCQT